MGTSNSPAELARKLARVAVLVEKDVDYAATEAAALLIKSNIVAIAPKRLKGVGKRGAKLGVRYNIGHYEAAAKALIYATGPFQLVERDTKAHAIPRANRRNRTVVHLPYSVQTVSHASGTTAVATVHHPGTKGKHPFEKGALAAMPLIGPLYDSRLALVMHEIF